MENKNEALKQAPDGPAVLTDKANHSHAWRGTWNRPMRVDENGMHPFTVARMTDHNVKATDREDGPEQESEGISDWENEGGQG